MSSKPWAALAATTLMAATLAGCTPAPAPSGTSSPAGPTVTLVTPGQLTLCTNPPYKPMEYTDSKGNLVGFDIDLMNIVAQKLGVTLSPVVTDFDPITSGAVFASKQCDVAASSISITAARKTSILFSAAYFSATQGLLVRSASGVKGLADLKGKKMSVQTDTTGADYANAHSNEFGYTVVTFDDAGVALSSVLSGQVDACLTDTAIVHSFATDNPTTAVATEFATGETYGIASSHTPTGQAMIDVVNQVLTQVNTDGTYLALYKKWIDPTAASAGLPD